MKDIDFDELDRAVSSVLGVEVAKKDEPTAVASPTIEATTAETVTDLEKSSVESEVDSSFGGTESIPALKKTLVQKRTSGRFMDVMHPSSDMKTSQMAPVSRQGVSITPVSAASVEEAAVGEPIEKLPDLKEERAPDPLDFAMSYGDESLGVEPEESAIHHDAPVADEGDMHALAQAASELSQLDGIMKPVNESVPLDTPFVSDPTVEKRPLGAFSLNDTDVTLLSDKAKAHLDVTQGSEPGNEAATKIDPEMDAMLAAALNGEDIPAKPESEDEKATIGESEPLRSTSAGDIAAEADSEIIGTESLDAQTVPDTEVTPEELQNDIVAIESRDVEPASTFPVGGGSITQQYAEKITKQSDETTPVFDVEPLKVPQKKSHTARTIVISILLMLLGVGAGVALYYFDLLSFIS